MSLVPAAVVVESVAKVEIVDRLPAGDALLIIRTRTSQPASSEMDDSGAWLSSWIGVRDCDLAFTQGQ